MVRLTFCNPCEVSMFGELIIPILLSMASPEAVDFVPVESEEITQYICEDDLLAGGERTVNPSDVTPAEGAPMHEEMMHDESMPMHENDWQDNRVPMHEGEMLESQPTPQPEPVPTRKRCSRCGKGHLNQ